MATAETLDLMAVALLFITASLTPSCTDSCVRMEKEDEARKALTPDMICVGKKNGGKTPLFF